MLGAVHQHEIGGAPNFEQAAIELALARGVAGGEAEGKLGGDIAQARQQLTDTVVRAPYDGVITRKDIYEGRFMATRMGGMPGGASGVVQLMDIDIVAAIVNVPEIYVSQIKLKMPADGWPTPELLQRLRGA